MCQKLDEQNLYLFLYKFHNLKDAKLHQKFFPKILLVETLHKTVNQNHKAIDCYFIGQQVRSLEASSHQTSNL